MVVSLCNLLADVAPVLLALGERLYQRCHPQESRRELGNALRPLGNPPFVESGAHLLARELDDEVASP